jgi:amino acid transporter
LHNQNQIGKEEITLSRTLGLLDVTMIGVGAMIGAGIFVLTGIAAGEAGPALVLAFLLNGIVTTFTALSYAELGSCFPEAGGGYLWVKEGLGGTQGFLAGWMSWFAHAVACSLYGLGFGCSVG